jgi:hypothetical protein
MTLLAALLHIFAFDVAYRYSVHPIFDYAGYAVNPSTPAQQLLTWALALAPVIVWRRSTSPASVGASLIYSLAYVPIIIMLLHMWQRDAFELVVLQASIAASMATLFLVAPRGHRPGEGLGERIHVPIEVLTTVAVCVVAFTYREHLRFVSFEDVYDLRAESSEVGQGSAVVYLVMWLPYALLPFHIVRWLSLRRPIDLVLGLVASLIIYMATASKAALLTPGIMIALNHVVRAGPDVLRALLVRLAAAQAAIVVLIPDEGLLFWLKSILLVRILGTSGWTASTYYEYFTTREFTFYTHIGPLNAIVQAYPYGEKSLGQLIGNEHSADELANFNAGFWASDGIAAMGIAGIPVVTVAVAAVLFTINRVSAGFSPRFVAVWLAGFWLAMLNLPLTTALLSGGGGLIMALLWLSRSRRQQAARRLRPSGGFDNATAGVAA